MPPGDLRLCNNCFKQGRIVADSTNDKACKNCRKTVHLAHDCQNEPVCNLCNISGHVAREYLQAGVIEERSGGARGGGYGGGYRDIICRTCYQLGHMSQDCMGAFMICRNCGGRGHLAYECPSGRFLDLFPRRY
ncbi:zinc knuckle (CCHC-type) family protein [Actinidia rufa]|uniref:Zinc knuckle (CCHC-type) family protein n=1 Tax=Actinidia rufa TaxID=165716 RepID=A0A7J0F7M8_9ERIC|nr:zinc knuckle (CCHC-type) family protein [Actinidia rufa]GFY94455.1 zinc knuckle (CCHC-type) family protein [Actinidia rufa]